MENYTLFFYFIMSFPCVHFLFCVILQKSLRQKMLLHYILGEEILILMQCAKD